MRVAVHSIAKDEAQHLERWAASAADADLLQIGDTGSTDGTPELATDLGITVTQIRVEPFRFDTARNAALAALPADLEVVITLDLDEVLAEGWREQLEQAYAGRSADRWTYDYVWSWAGPGEPDVQFTADRCYSRNGWQWHGAAHEVLMPSGHFARDIETHPAGFTIQHHPDATKSRSSYLPLLELAVDEEPHNPRQRFYLAREQFFHGHWVDARDTFVAFLNMPEATWPPERAEAYRYLAKMDDHPERWLLKAVAADPGRRDALVDLVDLYEAWEWWPEAEGMASRALRVTERPGDYMTTAKVWDDMRLRKVLTR
jgi:glycosyltransferase involved in cell wall biosynthesis